jgi:GH18 family chitinase
MWRQRQGRPPSGPSIAGSVIDSDLPDDVRTKVGYAARGGLGGVFIWELGQDKRVPGQAKEGLLPEAAAAAAASSAVDRYAGYVLGNEL